MLLPGIQILVSPVPSATLSYEVDFIGLETGLSVNNANSWIGDNAEQVYYLLAFMKLLLFLKLRYCKLV